jgi:hypothetical protein
VLSWQGELDPFVDLAADLRRALGQRLSLLLGIHVVGAPNVERERHGNDPIVSRKTVSFPNVLVGLNCRIW